MMDYNKIDQAAECIIQIVFDGERPCAMCANYFECNVDGVGIPQLPYYCKTGVALFIRDAIAEQEKAINLLADKTEKFKELAAVMREQGEELEAEFEKMLAVKVREKEKELEAKPEKAERACDDTRSVRDAIKADMARFITLVNQLERCCSGGNKTVPQRAAISNSLIDEWVNESHLNIKGELARSVCRSYIYAVNPCLNGVITRKTWDYDRTAVAQSVDYRLAAELRVKYANSKQVGE